MHKPQKVLVIYNIIKNFSSVAEKNLLKVNG